jgi:hypothetical protein
MQHSERLLKAFLKFGHVFIAGITPKASGLQQRGPESSTPIITADQVLLQPHL